MLAEQSDCFAKWDGIIATVKAKRLRRCAGDYRLRRHELHHEKAVGKFVNGRDVFMSVSIGSGEFECQ